MKLLASGGVDEYEILALNPVADGYGVGTSIANAPVLNFALDIMEIEGKPMAKRGNPARLLAPAYVGPPGDRRQHP